MDSSFTWCIPSCPTELTGHLDYSGEERWPHCSCEILGCLPPQVLVRVPQWSRTSTITVSCVSYLVNHLLCHISVSSRRRWRSYWSSWWSWIPVNVWLSPSSLILLMIWSSQSWLWSVYKMDQYVKWSLTETSGMIMDQWRYQRDQGGSGVHQGVNNDVRCLKWYYKDGRWIMEMC